MDQELLIRISTAFDEKPSLEETDALLTLLAVLRRKDGDVFTLADALLDYRGALAKELADAAASLQPLS